MPREQEQICDEFLCLASCTRSLQEREDLFPARWVRLILSTNNECHPVFFDGLVVS